MQFFSAANRQERWRRRAAARGELIDVSIKARALGIEETVFLSKRLWTSLIRPFPFAEPSDCISLATLLEALKAYVRATPDTSILYLTPPKAPLWFRGACYLKTLINSPADGPRSILVQPFSDTFPRCIVAAESALPSSLLVRLAKTLRNLIFVSRTAEQGLLRSMQTLVTQLIQSNPFHQEINAHLGPFPKEVSLPFPPDEYLPVLLADLDELLAILAQCADASNRPKIEALQSHYRALVSPLADFCQILEQLLQVVACGSNLHAPVQGQVFLHLLNLYAEIHARLRHLETEVTSDGLAVVLFQICLLKPKLAAPLADYVTGLERACNDLLINRLPDCTHGPSRYLHHTVVWH